MGASQSVIPTLEAILGRCGIKIETKTLRSFVKEVDRVAPWYACSGSLTIASWNKLGKDLDRHHADGDLRLGTKAIWKLVKNCLEDENCKEAVSEGQVTLEGVQNSMSETEHSERLGARKKKIVPRKERKEKHPPSKGTSNPKESDVPLDPPPQKNGSGLYPLEELEALNLDSSDSSSHDTSDKETLDSEEDAELDEEAARHEEERYHPDERRVNRRPPRAPPLQKVPTAPPPYAACPQSSSFVPEKVKRKLWSAFPVFETENGGRVHASVEYNQLKELAESVCKYGANANFTLVQLDRLAGMALTPADWQMIAKAALPSKGKYMK
jgi:protein O-GlcNAc transferase